MPRKTLVAVVAHSGAFSDVQTLRQQLSSISLINFPNKKSATASLTDVMRALVTEAEMLLVLAGYESARKASAPAVVEEMILKQAQRSGRPCMLALLGPTPIYLSEIGGNIGAIIVTKRDSSGALLDMCPHAQQLLLEDTPGILRYIREHAKRPPGDAGL